MGDVNDLLQAAYEAEKVYAAKPIQEKYRLWKEDRDHLSNQTGPYDRATDEDDWGNNADWCEGVLAEAMGQLAAERKTVAYQIAEAIEAMASDTSYSQAEEVTEHLLNAAKVAREMAADTNELEGRTDDATGV